MNKQTLTEAEIFFKECEELLKKQRIVDKIRLNTSKMGFILISRNIERYRLKRKFKFNNLFKFKFGLKQNTTEK